MEQIRGRAESLEHRPGGDQIQLRFPGIAHLLAGPADENPGAGRLVGRLQLLPDRLRIPQCPQRGPGITHGQVDRSLGTARERAEVRRPEVGGDLRQLLGRGTGSVEIARRDRHLHAAPRLPR